MSKYNNGVIYSIRFRDNDKLIYIGSTIQPLYKRFHDHKFKVTSLCNYIAEHYNYKWDLCYIELLEKFPCSCRAELEKREGEIIRNYKANTEYIIINTNKTSRKPTIEESLIIQAEKEATRKAKYEEAINFLKRLKEAKLAKEKEQEEKLTAKIMAERKKREEKQKAKIKLYGI